MGIHLFSSLPRMSAGMIRHGALRTALLAFAVGATPVVAQGASLLPSSPPPLVTTSVLPSSTSTQS